MNLEFPLFEREIIDVVTGALASYMNRTGGAPLDVAIYLARVGGMTNTEVQTRCRESGSPRTLTAIQAAEERVERRVRRAVEDYLYA